MLYAEGSPAGLEPPRPLGSVVVVDATLLSWFAASGRDLPWRRTRDPYAILVARGDAAADAGRARRAALPALARALADVSRRWPRRSTADVIREWQGLGYNRRAVSLHRAARVVAATAGRTTSPSSPASGRTPRPRSRNFAFGEAVLPVDTNVARVQERTGERFEPACGAGADGPRRDGLPRARAALRRLPARRRRARRAACATRRCASRGRFEGSFRQRRARDAAARRRAARALRLDDEAVASLARDGLGRRHRPAPSRCPG